jgi:serine/threonine-protein kinase
MEELYIGNYKIIDEIGSGGMARVYLAVHKEVPNLKVVLKVLTDSRLAARFRQEADKLALLDGHPNICRIKHFFNYRNDLVIAMEYIDGITLEDKIGQQGRLPIPEAVKIITKVLNVLISAHKKDVYHRDIKPSNIMVDNLGRIKIIDFGIAKSKSDPNLTITGSTTGTPIYMAPEQFVAKEDIDYSKCDIYAVGTMLYYITTGQLPFTGDNEYELRDSKLQGEPIRPSILNSEISQELENIILKAINVEPSKRFTSVSEMARTLRPYAAAEHALNDQTGEILGQNDKSNTTDGQPGQKPLTGPVLPPIPPRKKRWPAAKILLSLIGLIAAVIAITLIITLPDDRGISESITKAPEKDSIPLVPVIVPNPVTGTIQLLIKPMSKVYLNGSLFASGVAETTLVLDTGEYDIVIFNDSSIEKSNDTTFFLGSNDTVNLSIVFNFPSRPEPPPKPIEEPKTEIKPVQKPATIEDATLRIVINPYGDLLIDGKLIGDSLTDKILKLKAGAHLVRVENGDSRQGFFQDSVRLAGDDFLEKTYNFNIIYRPEFLLSPGDPGAGRLEIRTIPIGSDIYIGRYEDTVLQRDLQLLEPQTPHTLNLKTGWYFVKVTNVFGGEVVEYQTNVCVVLDQTEKVAYNFEYSRPY